MKKEELLQLGVSEELADKVLLAIEKQTEESNKQVEQLNAEIAAINEQLTEANKTIKSYKDMKIEDIKASATAWEEKVKTLEAELLRTKNESILDKALAGVQAQDNDLIKKLLDSDRLTFADGKVEGLEEQIKELKESKAYLFKPEDAESQYQGFQPEKSTGEGTSQLETTIQTAFNS